jgi:hypothetical protein
MGGHSAMTQSLQEAVAIFKTLGWVDVSLENVLQLPLGTPEQKRRALEGLKSGEWGEIAKTGENSYAWRSLIDADAGKLALFALRIGVDARRAANILPFGNAVVNDTELPLCVIAARGAKYATDFIGFACTSRRRAFEHAPSTFGNLAVRLVDKLNLDIPQSVDYMKDWSVYAAAALGLKVNTHYKEANLPSTEIIGKRFAEHILTGVAVGVPATGPFGTVLPAGVKRSLLPRSQAIKLVFSALDAAVRPGDRKVWLQVLDELGVTDEELTGRTQGLIPLLACGDAAAVVRLAPVLIAHTEGALLTETLLAALTTPTKKARQAVLKASIGRPHPENAEQLAPLLSDLASGTDKGVASLAAQLMQQWKIDAESPAEAPDGRRGLWQETPPLWRVPDFVLGEISPDALTELAARLVNQPAVIHDLTTERFLAAANALAYQSPESARMSLRGLRPGRDSFLDGIVCWVKGQQPCHGFDTDGDPHWPLTARDYVVCLQLDKLPGLLSTPSAADLSIWAADLAVRLALYKKAGANVLEADLFLALTRLDVKSCSPETARTLQGLDVPVVLQSGEKMAATAGQAVLGYLNDPIKEPSLPTPDGHNRWSNVAISLPSSLGNFPERLQSYQSDIYTVFPSWGDAAWRDICWDNEVYHHQGLVMRQAARRAAPLPPGASINMLAALRSSSSAAAAEDAIQAVSEAWERGLLRPGVADIAFLDWSAPPPSNLAALAAALGGVAEEGMLSVVWPILDDLLRTSLKAPRLLAGTAEIAELMAKLLPEAQSAAERGLTDETAFNLPGLRTLAGREGSSRAVSAARKLAALLPAAKCPPPQKEILAPALDPPFDVLWPERQDAQPLIDDGVTVSVALTGQPALAKYFLFTLALPDAKDRFFQVVKPGWCYDLESEGQCQASAATPEAATFSNFEEKSVWLHWDAEQNALVACEHRNWAAGKDGPLLSDRPSPLPLSLLTIVIGLLAQDGDAVYFAPRLLDQFIEDGQIGREVVRRATQTLLKSPAVSPAKLVRFLEKDAKLLPTLWPMLTECIMAAGASCAAGEKPPLWASRILDVALRHAPYLAEASKRGLIPAEEAHWPGLSDIAASKAKSASTAKAKKLLEALG